MPFKELTIHFKARPKNDDLRMFMKNTFYKTFKVKENKKQIDIIKQFELYCKRKNINCYCYGF